MLVGRLIPVLLAALLVSACAGQLGPKETGGTLIGGLGGAVVGAQMGHGEGRLLAVAAGTLLGALLGGEVGRHMDQVDQVAADRAYQQAQTAPIGQNIAWNNPDNGHTGGVTPVRDGTSAAGEYCREFQQTVTIGGRTEQAYGVACQQPDGSWRIRQ